LLVDLVNNVTRLAENVEDVLARARVAAKRMNVKSLQKAVKEYGGLRARKFFNSLN
jgi:hypothetical protein